MFYARAIVFRNIYWREIKCFHKLIYFSQLRSASNYRRPLKAILPQDFSEEIRANVFSSRNELSDEEWRSLQDDVINRIKNINKRNVDATILGFCNEGSYLPLARNYIEFLQRNGNEANQATLGRLLRIFNMAYHHKSSAEDSFSKKEETEILRIYRGLREKHEVFDAATCENLILGLVATSQWRDSLELLEMIRISAVPTVNAYCEIAMKAFKEHDIDLGWKILEEMLSDKKQPKCELYLTFIEAISRNQNDEFFRMQFQKLLEFLEKHDLMLTEKVVEAIIALSSSDSNKLIAQRATLNRIGKCSNCGLFMQQASLSDDEFRSLCESFLEKVLIRKDVFQKSTPEEVARFEKYVERTRPYDCVIDGLNVAYSTGTKKSPKVLANLLVSVVQYFKNRRKSVLVLGRRHMNQWPKESMQYIKQNAALFLTNDLSHDDPFLLYATLRSGRLTDFFSRDLMRTHSFLLGPELKTIFRRWQQEHQYSLVTQTGSGGIIVKEPVRHMMCAHKVKDTWHLPFKTEYSINPPETFEIPDRWLCLKFKK